MEETPKDVFDKSMGTLGRYQIWIAFLITLVKFSVGWHLLNIIIIGPKVQVDCLSPNNTNACDPACKTIKIDPAPFTQTIQSQWGLVCRRNYLADFAQMLMMLGVMVGAFLFGMWADKRGRKWPLLAACGIQAICGTVIAFVPWLWLFLILRFLIGFATVGVMTASFVLLMEFIGKKRRITVALLYQIPSLLAHLLLSPIGYYLRDWRHSQLLIGAPSFLFISYYWLLPESPRYLVAKERVDEAIAVMERVARGNKLPTESIAADVNAYANQVMYQSGPTGRVLDLFRPRAICYRTLILAYVWVATGVGFFGVAQYSGNLAGNIFANIAISAAMEIPGLITALIMVECIGRKWTSILYCAVAGVPMLVLAFLREGSIAVPIMALIAMFGMAALFAIIYVYSSELYPTFIRSIGIGFVSMICRIGTISAPFIASLSYYGLPKWMPPFIFACMSLSSCILIFFLPETKNDKLPDTLEDALNLGKLKSEGDSILDGLTD